VVVAMMGAMDDPEVGSGPVSSDWGTAGEIATEAALLVAQVMVDVWPLFTSVGVALKFVIWGTTGGGGVVFVPLVPHPGSCQKVSSAMPKPILRR